MGSYISYQTWGGGSDANDPRIGIGYCKEDPIEVLKVIARTHDIYHFEELYRPLNYNCNVTGLCITKSKAPNGCKIIASVHDLDLSIAKTSEEMSDESILYALEQCKKWHTYGNSNSHCRKLTKEYHKNIDNIITMVENGEL